MRPIRKKHYREVTDNPVTGRERPLEETDETDVLSDEGSIDTHGTRRRYPCDCGCYKPTGGRCAECGRLSCVSCHGHCEVCAKPLCLEDSCFPEGRGRLRLCRRCYERVVRHKRIVTAARLFLSPFVRFEGDP